jgi:3-(3-hydroxy-phenyl)propionate hydroxylase
VGRGFVLIGRGFDPLAALTPEQARVFARLPATTAAMETSVGTGSATVAFDDVDGVYRQWFDINACAAVVVRPDAYVYASARSPAELTAILDGLLAGLVVETSSLGG